ncbi:MAG TPA: hypothetical protein VKB79_12875 [Bryobacteraceae bacterium]|nr:hypothetical protein [Bryobacteraceae bacterium]
MDQTRLQQALSLGVAKAKAVIAQRKDADERRALALARLKGEALLGETRGLLRLQSRVVGAAPLAAGDPHSESAGFLVALGDSWFDYPVHDVLTKLHDDFGYNIESTAHRGDPVELMAYGDGQVSGLGRMFQKIAAQGATPKAVLMSGGGDDIAGVEFGMLLNSKLSPITGWNKDVLQGVILDRIETAYVTLFAAIDALSNEFAGKQLPILVHGYDYPVPDGRGFLGGFWFLPGPWLQPGFREKHFDDLQTCTDLMKEAIDDFNSMLETVVAESTFQNVKYVDLRGTLSNLLTEDAYKAWWANELHPTDDGFRAVAAKFDAILRTIP